MVCLTDNVEGGNEQDRYTRSRPTLKLLISPVDLTTLNVQQLSEVKKQLDDGIAKVAFMASHQQNSNIFHNPLGNYDKRETSFLTASKRSMKEGSQNMRVSTLCP
jgi:hypothetical protein